MATAVITPTDGELRAWITPRAKWGDPYQLAARVRWRPTEPGAADLTLGLSTKPITRAVLRVIAAELRRHGIHRVYTTRHDGGLMPGGQLMPDGSVCVDIAPVLSRLARKKTPHCGPDALT